VAHRGAGPLEADHVERGTGRLLHVAVLLVASAIYFGCIVSPPSLMDDVDAVQAQIARTMLSSGDWVTPRLDGVAYLEKAPLVYWSIALSFRIFGVHDWAARIPLAASAVALCWVTAAFGTWAFGRRTGFYAGLCLATCAGLFLFTRVLIPDVMLTLAIAGAMWSLLRALDEEERRPRLWAHLLALCLGAGLLLKSLIGALFPVAAGLIYLGVTRELFALRTWKRLRPFGGLIIVLAVALPWHVLATLRNPPHFAFTLTSGPGRYHGFLWFFLINEQLLRFLNLRFPRDYNTVPRLYFWLLHVVWLFPWSVYFPSVAKLSFAPVDRAGRTRVLALCWSGFILVFFTFSTTQEYYSMPCYPALALLLGSAMAVRGNAARWEARALAAVAGAAACAFAVVLFLVRGAPAPGDISAVLIQRPGAYTLSLGHMGDLTLAAFAYLRAPLIAAFIACAIGAVGMMRGTSRRAFAAAALMMVLFCHAARLAMVAFDPYLSSRPLADVLERSPEGLLIADRHYYPFSSVFFYTNRTGLLLNGRVNNLEYGSNAPDAPPVFIDDPAFAKLWREPRRYYLLLSRSALPRVESLVGRVRLHVVAASGGKYLLTNLAL
jgi:4-amino-4-deoxy-L-arabinose transferase-like glycosyltransferase